MQAKILNVGLFVSAILLALIVGCSETNDVIVENPGAVSTITKTSELNKTAGRTGSFNNGVNLQPAYYCNGDQNLGWALMNQYSKIQTVRIEYDNSTSSTVSDLSRWIREAQSNGKTVIATFHRYGGSNDVANILEAANFWKTNYSTLSAGGAFTINMINEWGDHNITSQAYADAYNQAIAIVRQVYSGAIICDIPGWGQETHTAADASKLIKDTNIIFSAHIYPSAWNSRTGKNLVAADLDYLNTCGRPCMVGEFGPYARGSADWSGLVDHAKALGWTVIGWAWNGDGTKPNKMNMASPYWGDNSGCSTSSFTKSSYFDIIYNKL